MPARLSALLPLLIFLLLCLGSNPVAFAQKRKQPELVAAPPPVVTGEFTVTAGDSIAIPLGIHGSRGRQLEFLVRVRPKIGKLSPVTVTGANSATVNYTAPADTDATEDKFAYAVRSGEGVSAPGIVTIKLLPKPIMPGRLEVPEALKFPATVIGKETTANFEITNSGGSPVSGEVTVSPPWALEGDPSYHVKPKGRVAMRLVFRPDRAGAIPGDVVFGPDPRKVMSLTGEGRSSIEVKPARLKLVGADRGQTRTGTLEIENVLDEARVIGVSTDARLMTVKSVEVGPQAKVQLPVFAEPGDGSMFQDVVHLSAGEWKLDIPVEVEALQQRLKMTVDPAAVLSGAAGQSAEFAVLVENEGGRPITAKLAATAPFAIADASLTIAPGEKKQVKVASPSVPDGENIVEISAENEDLVRRIKVPFVAVTKPAANGTTAARPPMPRTLANAEPPAPPAGEAETPATERRPPPSSGLPRLVDTPNAFSFPVEDVGIDRATLVWPTKLEPKGPFVVEERRLKLVPKKPLQVLWTPLPHVAFSSDQNSHRAALTGLQPATLYTLRVAANGQTLYTVQFTTKVKKPLFDFSWSSVVIGALVIALGLIGWKMWKGRQQSGW